MDLPSRLRAIFLFNKISLQRSEHRRDPAAAIKHGRIVEVVTKGTNKAIDSMTNTTATLVEN